MNKEKKKIGWEGIKKELPWILFWLAVLFLAWSYYQDKEELKAITEEECYKLCSWDKAVEEIRIRNPGVTFDCNYEANKCTYHGVKNQIRPGGLINLSILNETAPT